MFGLTLLLLSPAMLDIPPAAPAPASVPPRIWVSSKRTPGRHIPLSLGSLYVPEGLEQGEPVPLVVHFHGSAWLPEVAETQTGHKFAVVSIDLGVGSDVYQARFADPASYSKLLAEVTKRLRGPVGPVTLSGFSAGYGAVREILKNRANWDSIDTVVLVDGMHAAYKAGRSGIVLASDVAPFVAFAREAIAGRKRMLVTHSEVYPGAFASTKETADFLLSCLSLTRHTATHPGPFRSMRQTSEAEQGDFRLLGFAGSDAPDHFDQFQALSTWWKLAAVWESQRPATATPSVLISLTKR